MNPASSQVFNNLGEAHLKENNLDQAEKMFLTASKLERKYGDYHANLALVHFLKKQHKKAIADLIQTKLLGFENNITRKLSKVYRLNIIVEKHK